MAWQAATLRPASLSRPCCPCNEASFARIIPSNDLAKIEAALLAEQNCDGSFPQCHGNCFHAKEPPSVNVNTPTASDSESKAEDVDRIPCESHYALHLDNLSSIDSPLIFRMGSGASDPNEEGNDVEFLTCCPGRPSQKVMPIHCGFAFGSSGVCLIKALSTRPTIIFIRNEPVTLRRGETHVLCYRTNRFIIGNLEYNFVFNELGDHGYAAFVLQRNMIFKTLGIPLPDPRVWSISTGGERRIIGPAIMQACTGRGASGERVVGVHLRNGESLAIKSLLIDDKHKWDDILVELRVLLSFQGARGLLQALEVRCAHGHRINHESVQKLKGAVVQFCTAEYDTVYVITRLAETDFSAYGWAKWAEKGMAFKVCLLRDILQGVKSLHDAGYMHRNISEQNLLIVSEKPPMALVSDYGQSIVAKTSTEERIGPAHIRAPELGCTEYGNSMDIWNLGFVALSIFFPLTYDIVSNFGGAQDEVWYEQMDKELDNFMIQGGAEALIVPVLRSMLYNDPQKRPSTAHALAVLPELNWEDPAYQKSPRIVESTSESAAKRKATAFALDRPPRKLQKRADDEEIPSSYHGDDNSKSVDSDDYETDDENKFDEAFKALRRLPSDGDLRDLLIALPAGVALPDVMARCNGKDALHIKNMIRQGKERDASVLIPIPCHRRDLRKLRECFELEKTGDKDDDESASYLDTPEAAHSGARSKRTAGQEGLGALKSRMNAETSPNKLSQSNEGTTTLLEVNKHESKAEVEYVSSEESEEE